jgi:hypothetical protein
VLPRTYRKAARAGTAVPPTTVDQSSDTKLDTCCLVAKELDARPETPLPEKRIDCVCIACKTIALWLVVIELNGLSPMP